jgi:hypothetical protein
MAVIDDRKNQRGPLRRQATSGWREKSEPSTVIRIEYEIAREWARESTLPSCSDFFPIYGAQGCPIHRAAQPYR